MTQHRCMGCMALTENEVCEKCGYSVNQQNEPHQLPAGTILRGQYMVGRVLGQGGFGITYLGWDTYLDVPVAIKEYYPNSLVNRECSQSLAVHCYTEAVRPGYITSKERFLREAKALARFEEEPAIVRIKSFFPENETAYIVMEYVRGTNLAKYVSIRGGKLTPEETLRILKPVMEALVSVHTEGLIHRDISPDNIILHPKGGAKLLDFGAVRSVENADTEKALTRSTEAILKHGFAPMEQYQNRGSLGPWTDVYALCATIFYCLTGSVPEDAPARMMEEWDPDWSEIPGLTKGQKSALSKGMELRAKNRITSVEELMRALYDVEDRPLPEERDMLPAPENNETVTEPVKPEKVTVSEEKAPPILHTENQHPMDGEYKDGMVAAGSGHYYLPQKEAAKNTHAEIRRKKTVNWKTVTVCAVILLLLAGAMFAVTAKTGWYQENGSYSYYRWPGERFENCWLEEDGRYYFFDQDGRMLTGWLNSKGLVYYFGTDGVMVSGWKDIDGNRYYFGEDGTMSTGWRKIGSYYYYFRVNGVMATGWWEIQDGTYYFGTDGRMRTETDIMDGVIYRFGTDGKLIQ